MSAYAYFRNQKGKSSEKLGKVWKSMEKSIWKTVATLILSYLASCTDVVPFIIDMQGPGNSSTEIEARSSKIRKVEYFRLCSVIYIARQVD